MRFIEDGIWYVCPPTKIRSSLNGYLVRWKDGKWYSANIHHTGGMYHKSMSNPLCYEMTIHFVLDKAEMVQKKRQNECVGEFY